MTQREWPVETKQRAEKAMAELEAFFDTIYGSTPFGRQAAMARLGPARFSMVAASLGDSYVMQKLTSLEGFCKKLALKQQPASYNESSVLSQGLGAVSSIRAQLHSLGLVESYSRPQR